MTVTMAVAATSGMTANWPSVAKNSENGTSPKKSMTGRTRAMTMPTVMATEISAEAIRTPLMTDSSGPRPPSRGPETGAGPSATGLHRR